jgi:hypothetical protein
VVARRRSEGWKSDYVIYNSHRPPAMQQTAAPALMPPFYGTVDQWFTYLSDWLTGIWVLALAAACLGFAAWAVRPVFARSRRGRLNASRARTVSLEATTTASESCRARSTS